MNPYVLTAPPVVPVPASAVPPADSASTSPALASVQGSAAYAGVGSSSVAPAQRRYHTRVGPTPPSPPHPRLARRAPPPRGPGLQALGSRPLRELGRHPYRLIRVFLEPQTYPLHPLSGGLTFIASPSRGMLTAAGEIYLGRFTMISRHLPRTRSSETPCSSCRDTIYSRS